MKRSWKMHGSERRISRRTFARLAGSGLAAACLPRARSVAQGDSAPELALARNAERGAAYRTAVDLLGAIDFAGRDIYLKASFNSPHPFPATTHPDTLRLVAETLRKYNCRGITLIERSGMGDTADIWNRLGISSLARELDMRLVALERLAPEDWRKVELPGMNWANGVEVPRFLDRETFVVQICNLKTHRFGGIFSASLKNAIGLVAKFGQVQAGYNYMQELHSSPLQGSLIAEVNLVYEPKLIIMDAMEVFVSGGPESGELAAPGVFIAGSNRVAMDAAGVALLRLHTAGPAEGLLSRPVFEQEQLKRSLELGLGEEDIQNLRFLTADQPSDRLASQLEAILSEPAKAK